MMKLEINLWELLAKKKITVKKLSELTWLSQQQLSTIKHGRTTKISFKTLEKFLEVFECEPNDLFIKISDVKKK